MTYSVSAYVIGDDDDDVCETALHQHCLHPCVGGDGCGHRRDAHCGCSSHDATEALVIATGLCSLVYRMACCFPDLGDT